MNDGYLPGPSDGNVQGETKDLPNRGTESGMVGQGAPYGADIGPNATNRKGGMTHADSGSDPRELRFPKGDEDRFSSSGHSSPDEGGSKLQGTDSDPIDKTRSNQKPGL